MIKLDVISHGDLTSQPWEDGWDTIHVLAAAVREGVLDPDSRVEGELRVSVACRSEVKRVNERFAGVVKTSEEVMQFEDKAVCEAFANGGVPIGKSAFTAMTSIGTKLAGNTKISQFLELNQSAATTIEAGAFYNCSSLKNINTAKIKQLNFEYFNNGLRETRVLERMVLPNAVEVGRCWWYGGSLTSNFTLMDFGPNMKTAKAYFYQVTPSHVNMVFRSNSVPSMPEGSLVGTPKAIYVQPSLVDAYKNADGWKSYSSIIYPISGEKWQAEFGSSSEYADFANDPCYDDYVREFEALK